MQTNALLRELGASLVAFDRDRLELTMHFSPSDMFRQGTGHIQGGAIAAILDFAMVFPAFAVIDEDAGMSTTMMTTSYYAPGKAETYKSIGRVEKAGRRVIYTSAQLFAGEKLVAGASSTLLVLPAAG